MRTTVSAALACLTLAAATGCEEPLVFAPLPPLGDGIDVRGRLSNTTCLAFESPRPEDVRVSLEVAFGGETFSRAVKLVQHPVDDDRWYVVEQGTDPGGVGTVHTFLASDPAGTRSVAATVTNLQTFGEQGLLGMAFHPDFAANGEVYLYYIDATFGMESVVARYVSADGGLTFSPHPTELEVLRLVQPARNHNAGELVFGPDGYLYVSLGDGGGGGSANAQDLGNLYGSILRLDVDSHPYAIPPDNPFVESPPVVPDPALDEIWAYGLRNPWRMSFDMLTGDLWVGDVGQTCFEEIDLVEKGDNLGWNLKEGFRNIPGFGCDSAQIPVAGLKDPVWQYGRDEGRAVAGGFVYRGDDIAGLAGAYVYGDWVSGKIWGLFDGTSAAPLNVELIASGLNISAFGQGRDGEIYVLHHDASGAPIRRLVPPDVGGGGGEVPALLSETGCVDPDDPTRFAPGVIPYAVNAPLWSDGVEKRRGMAIPDGTMIRFGADGDFDFPVGSVLVKHFQLGDVPIETRLFMRHEDDVWEGYSYEWDAAGTDATLLDDGKVEVVAGMTWTFPSPTQCLECHTEEAGHSLGPELAQLEGDFDYDAAGFAHIAGVENQLDVLHALGVLARRPPLRVDALPDLLSAAPVADRARAYLHANCSFCHRPGGPGGGAMDLRYATDLAGAGICDAVPSSGDAGIVDDPRLVAPGVPERSVLLARMRDTGPYRMPPLASWVVDDEAAAVVEQWIEALGVCP